MAGARSTRERAVPLALLLVVGLLVAAVVLMAIGGRAELLRPAGKAPMQSDFVDFSKAIEKLEPLLNWALWTIVPIGVVVGGALLAIGSKKGVQVWASSIGAGVAVMLGKGLIA